MGRSVGPRRQRSAAFFRYGVVGLVAAAIHTLLLLLGRALQGPLPLFNLAGFLLASLWGYLAHALFTFRSYTEGERFPRRWLVLQFGTIVSLSLWLPWRFPHSAASALGMAVLVFLPSAVNALIWCLAARQVVRLRRGDGLSGGLSGGLGGGLLWRHADDLGLDPAVNQAIFELHDRGQLEGASVLLNGPALAEAQRGLASRPGLRLCLHLVLSEGPPVADPERVSDLLDREGHLRLGFLTLLLLSFWPAGWDGPAWRRLRAQIALEVNAQIAAFQRLWPERPLRLDGHQHIHLVPLVWRQLISQEPPRRPVWLRSLGEPIPLGLPLRSWWTCLVAGGALKWLLLRLLSAWQVPRLRALGIATNHGFAGVLCTGRMGAREAAACARTLKLRCAEPDAVASEPTDTAPIGPTDTALIGPTDTAPMLLSHPALRGFDAAAAGFRRSQAFYRSPWRCLELQALSSPP